jgi:hypothetical protein
MKLHKIIRLLQYAPLALLLRYKVSRLIDEGVGFNGALIYRNII